MSKSECGSKIECGDGGRRVFYCSLAKGHAGLHASQIPMFAAAMTSQQLNEYYRPSTKAVDAAPETSPAARR